MDITDIIRIINIPIILLAIIAWIIFYKKYKLVGAIAPLAWLIHVFAYTIFKIFFEIYSKTFCMIWTSLIITHAAILLFIAACISVPGKKNNIRG